MRDRLNQAVKDAMKSGDKRRLATLRLITAALKDRDLGIGQSAQTSTGNRIGDDEILQLLQKMVKQRRDSIEQYKAGGRADLVEQEEAEIRVIEEFLPSQLSEAETQAAVTAAIADAGCVGLKDMGKVMAVLKAKYAGRMDFARASAIAKDRLK